MRLSDGSAARFEAEHLELPMVHLVQRVHQEGLVRIGFQVVAAVVVLRAEVKPVHLVPVVVLQPLHLV